MGLINRFRLWAAQKLVGGPNGDPRIRSRYQPTKGERILAALFPAGKYGWPGGWSQDRLEQVQHYRHWVYVATSLIMDQIKQLHPNVAMVAEGAKPPSGMKRIRADRMKTLNVVQQHEELDLVDFDHPLRRLMANPNPVDTAADFYAELELYKMLCGVSYVWAVPSSLPGLPAELWVIPAHWVWPRTGSDRLIEYYEVRPWGGLGSAGVLRFPADEVIEFKDKSPLNKIDGYSPLMAAAQWVDTEESISASRWSQFKNRARPEMWVEIDKEVSDPDDNDIARIQARIAEKLMGEYQTGRPLVMGAGMKINQLSWSPEEMGYIQSEDQIRDMILATYKLPKAAAGLSEGMTYGSVLAVMAGVFKFAINPRLSYNSQVMTEKLAKRFDKRARIWWNDGTPPDPTQVNADLEVDLRNGLLTPNEGRQVRNREPYPHGGDDPMFPMGVSPVPFNTGEDLSGLEQLTPMLDRKETVRENLDAEDEGDEKPKLKPLPKAIRARLKSYLPKVSKNGVTK